jgi:hypothetical protein
MKKTVYTVSVMIAAVLWHHAAARAGDTLEITRTGRNIQLDGVLIEWQQEHADTLPVQPLIRWDCVLTPAGVAGYFMTPSPRDSCDHVSLEMVGSGGYVADTLRMDFDTTGTQRMYYRNTVRVIDSVAMRICEWLLPHPAPLDSMPSAGRIHLTVYPACGDTMAHSLVMALGDTRVQKGRRGSANLVLRVALIAALLGAYLLLRRRGQRIRRKKPQEYTALSSRETDEES